MMGSIKKTSCTLSISLVLSLTSLSPAQQLTISDPHSSVGHARLPEVIEIPLNEARKHIPDIEHRTAEIAATHETLTTQIYSSPEGAEHNLLLIAIQLPASGKMTINFVPTKTDKPAKPLVFGREAPERKDDFAWENQMVAYRVYGPALEATGEITSGIDVWSKRVPNLVIDRFYKHDAEGARTHNPALSYHKDDGIGLDSYLVGPTRGCGGTGVLSNGKLWVSKNYNHLKQISTGPVRFEFEMTYAPWNANGIQVTETKRITLDAGTHLNKIQSTFTFTGTDTIDAAAGVAIRPNAQFEQLEDGHILSVWDTPQDPTAGRIAIGMIAAPNQKSTALKLDNQGFISFPVHAGQPFTYFAGSGWSKADMPTQQVWDEYLKTTLTQLQNPLQIHWEDNQPVH